MLPPRVLLPLVLSASLCAATLPRDYGEAVIAGGRNDDGDKASVETIGGPSLPALPLSVSGNSLTLVGSVLYSCANVTCYTYDTSSTATAWSHLSVTFPQPLYGHTAVAIDSHIWFIQNNSIFDLDTTTRKFLTYETTFEVDNWHCAASDGKHCFVLGAGHQNNEIWLNSVKYSPSKWEYVGNLSVARTYFGCVWLSNYIVSTGGFKTYASTELFDTNTWTSKVNGDLVEGRNDHQMFVLDGRAAVVGGDDYDGNHHFASIETFDFQTGKWTTDPRQLSTAIGLFGLAQFND